MGKPRLVALVVMAGLSPLSAAFGQTAKTATVSSRPYAIKKTSIGSNSTGNTKRDTNPIVVSVPVQQFDTAAGILTGAELIINMGYKVLIEPRASEVYGTYSSRYTPVISNYLVSPIAGGELYSAGYCQYYKDLCRNQSDTARIMGSSKIKAESLSNFAGSGTSSIAINATGMTEIVGRRGPSLDSTFTFGSQEADSSDNISVKYSYLDFANPSFSRADPSLRELTLDFGDIAANNKNVIRAFSSSNFGSINNAGLSLKSFSSVGSGFATGIDLFDNLSAGDTLTSELKFYTSKTGSFEQNYSFLFEDYALGGIGTRTYQLNLRAIGTVSAPAVPEPATWAMMMVGFAMVGGTARYRRRSIKASLA